MDYEQRGCQTFKPCQQQGEFIKHISKRGILLNLVYATISSTNAYSPHLYYLKQPIPFLTLKPIADHKYTAQTFRGLKNKFDNQNYILVKSVYTAIHNLYHI